MVAQLQYGQSTSHSPNYSKAGMVMVPKDIPFGSGLCLFSPGTDFCNCIKSEFLKLFRWMVRTDPKEGHWESGRNPSGWGCGWSIQAEKSIPEWTQA